MYLMRVRDTVVYRLVKSCDLAILVSERSFRSRTLLGFDTPQRVYRHPVGTPPTLTLPCLDNWANCRVAIAYDTTSNVEDILRR